PTKKSDPIIYQAKEIALPDRLLAEFRGAKGLKAKTQAAAEALKNFADLENQSAVAQDLIAGLNADIATHQRTQPAVALEGIFIRDEIRQAGGLPAVEGEISSNHIWSQDVRVG